MEQAPNGSNLVSRISLIVVLVFLAGIAYWFWDNKQNEVQAPAVPTPMNVRQMNAGGINSGVTPSVNDGVVSLQMDAFEYGYSSTSLAAKPGDTIRIMLNNTGQMTHDFVIDELNVRSKILESGESETIEFTIPNNAANSYTFYCSVGSHRDMGMEGTIQVSR